MSRTADRIRGRVLFKISREIFHVIACYETDGEQERAKEGRGNAYSIRRGEDEEGNFKQNFVP